MLSQTRKALLQSQLSSRLLHPIIPRLLDRTRSFCSHKSSDDDFQQNNTEGKPGVEFDYPDDEDILKEDVYSEDGKKVLEYDTNKVIEKDDWVEFEKIFGIDKYHKIPNLEDWTFESYDDNDGDNEFVDEDDDFEEKKAKLDRMFGENGRWNSDHVDYEQNQKLCQEKQDLHWRKFEEFVQASLQNSSDIPIPMELFHPSCQHKTENEDDHENQSKRRTPKRHIPDDGSTQKFDRRTRSSYSRKTAQPTQTNSNHNEINKQKTIGLPVIPADNGPSDDFLKMPVNSKRPGYERRLRSLQVEMERIASEVLGQSGSEFDEYGGIMQHALLSPDGFTLQIFFELDNLSRFKANRKYYKNWKRRISSEVRAALASQLYAKRVPKVELMYSKSDSGDDAAREDELRKLDEISLAHYTDQDRQMELGELFDQIALERNKIRSQSDRNDGVSSPDSDAQVRRDGDTAGAQEFDNAASSALVDEQNQFTK